MVRFPLGQTLGVSHFNSSVFKACISASVKLFISLIAKDFASDNASYITGQTFHVNGGMMM